MHQSARLPEAWNGCPRCRGIDAHLPWNTHDGHIRHEILENGRYVEARGTRERAYEGRYEIAGDHIDYWDDTGFTDDGTFVEPDVLHHAGMILHRSDRCWRSTADRVPQPSLSD